MPNPLFRFSLTHNVPNGGLQFTNNSFEVSISGWTQITLSDQQVFVWNSLSSARSDGSVSHFSGTSYIGQTHPTDLRGWNPGKYIIEITATNTSTGGSAPLQSILNISTSEDGATLSGSVTYEGVATWDVGAGAITRRVSFELDDFHDYILFSFSKVGPTSAYFVKFTVDLIDIIQGPRLKLISDPLGWKQSKFVLERDKDFHSLVEYFNGSFVFYGSNGIDDGGIDFIKSIEKTYGFDADIEIKAEISVDAGLSYNIAYDGLLDLANLQEIPYNKIQVPVIPNDVWTKFFTRKDTKVNLQATTDLDGVAITPFSTTQVQLSSQSVRKSYHATREQSFAYGSMNSVPFYGMFGFDTIVLDEIKTIYNEFAQSSATLEVLPITFLVAEFAGTYTFDIKYTMSRAHVSGSGTVPDPFVFSWQNLQTWFQIFIQINDQTRSVFSRADFLSGATRYSEFTKSTSYTLNAGDRIIIYGETIQAFNAAAPGDELVLLGTDPTEAGQNFFLQPFPLSGLDTHIIITADTTFPETTSDGFLIHDAGASIIQNIGLGNIFQSEVLGSSQTIASQYVDDGCYWKNILVQGLQLRGYSLSTKQLSMSFMDWWNGVNPMFSLGLGLTTDNKIEVESTDEFYDLDVSLYISNAIFTREYDISTVYKQIEIGYNKWQSEEIAGIDDPQTVRTYATRFKKVGEDVKIKSNFIAASIAIEVTRRESIKESKDYKYDNDLFIISLNTSGSPFVPELDENFTAVTGLINSTTRYNIIHTPSRMLLRWAKYLNGCLQKYLTSEAYRFVSAEGNYAMTSDYDCASAGECSAIICDVLSENQSISLVTYGSTLGYLHLPDLFIIEVSMSLEDYLTIRDNRKKAIAVSQSTTYYGRFFIRKLEYWPALSKAKIEMYAYDPFEITVPLSINPPPPGGWVLLPPVDPSGCNTLFYEAYFTSNLEGWVSDGGTDIPASTLEALIGWDNAGIVPLRAWSLSTTPDNSLNGDGDYTDYIRGSIVSIPGLTYQFSYQIDIVGSGVTTGSFRFYLLDSSNNILDTQVVAFTSNGTKSGSVTLTPSGSNGAYVAIQIINTTPFNSKSFEIQSMTLSGGTGASSVALPSWAWNSSFAGSAKASVLYAGYGVKNLLLSSTSLPSADTRIFIRYSVNNSDITLRFKIKDVSDTVIFNTVFASGETSSAEQTATIDITNLSVLSDAKKFEILVESTDFQIGDMVYITDFSVIQCIDISDGTFDADYQAILDRGTALGYTLPSPAQQQKQNQLVLDLKASNIWTSLDILYVPATDGDSDFATINWITPASFQLTKVNSPTFTTNIGFTGNGSSMYLNTGWAPNPNTVHFALNDNCAFAHLNHTSSAIPTSFDFGFKNTASGRILLKGGSLSNHTYADNATGTGVGGPTSTPQGFFQVQRTASNVQRLLKNASQVGSTNSNASDTISTRNCYLLCLNENGTAANFTDGTISFFGIGSSLSAKESDLYTAWNTYFTSL
jgi:hypothetical protein